MSAHPTQLFVTTEITSNIGRVTFSNLLVNPLNRAECAGLVAAISGADHRPQTLPLSSLHDEKETSGQQ